MLGCLAALLLWGARAASAQDMGMDDGGGDTGGDDMSDVLDPTLMGMGGQNNGLMYGAGAYGPGGSVSSLANLKVQTLLALQELGVVVGVAFMVAGIFLLMVYMEKFWTSVVTRYNKKFGNPVDDVEDPAALVGTFKRYKN